MINKIKIIILAFVFTMCCVVNAFAENYCIRQGASGTGSGADWTNAFASMADAGLHNSTSTGPRGHTYYVADGSYGALTLNNNASGTSLITIKKATAADHGTDTGWNSAYGDGQAIFGYTMIYKDYYLIDGQVRNSDWYLGELDEYGFKIDYGIRLDDAGSNAADNVTFRYVDGWGGGRDTGEGDDVVYSLVGSNYITFQYCALHDSDRTIFLLRNGPQSWSIESCYIARNASSVANHGEISSTTDGDNFVWKNNIIEDPEGTAVWAFLNDGTATGWKFYGNLIFHSTSYDREGIAGVIFVANDASNANTLNNALFYNNTIAGIEGAYSGIHIESGTGNVVKNNIWYNNVETGNAGNSASYNWYYSTSGYDTDIFTNISTKNFALTGTNLPNAGDNSIGSEYNTDMFGSTRGSDGVWDRGAYEYTDGEPTPTPTPAPASVSGVTMSGTSGLGR